MTAFRGRTVIVTGAGRGIGAAIAHRFAREDADVMLVDVDEGGVGAQAQALTGEGLRAWPWAADLADRSAIPAIVDAALERWGGIDILVNNAGIAHAEPFLEHAPSAWDRVLAINLTAPFLLAQAVGRHMAERGRGAVVHIASIDALFADGPFVGYNAAKAGLLGLMRTMALELGPHGVRSNAVLPGFTATEMVRRDLDNERWERMRTQFARSPLGRMVEPDEIAAAVCFLASDQAAAITGASLVVDAGVTADVFVGQTLDRG